MQTSIELRNLILQLYENKSAGGLLAIARQFYSHQEGILVIGSQPGDRYEGYESITHFYEREGAGGLQLKVEELVAYSEGPFGWVIDRVIAKLPDGQDVPVRHTYIFHQEKSEWKIVHAHISVGVPDESLGLLPIKADT